MNARTFLISVLVAGAAVVLATSTAAFAVSIIAGRFSSGSTASMMAGHMNGSMGTHMGGGIGPMATGPSAADQPTVAATGPRVTVKMVNNSFQPAKLEVAAGTTVTWINEDAAPHTATANDRSWDSGIFNRGESWSHTFETAGTYGYVCLVHPGMTGVVEVTN